MVFSFDSFPWLSPLKYTQTHTHIYRSNAAHATTYKYDGRIENDRDGCHRGVRHDRVFSFPREWKGTAKVRRSGVFGNVRRRTQRMGEIGSRAIHRCVVVFLSLSLVGRTMRARVCVGFKARCRLAFERNTRERRERKVYEETPIPIVSGKAIASSSRFRPPKTRFVRELFSTFHSPKEARR